MSKSLFTDKIKQKNTLKDHNLKFTFPKFSENLKKHLEIAYKNDMIIVLMDVTLSRQAV